MSTMDEFRRLAEELGYWPATADPEHIAKLSCRQRPLRSHERPRPAGTQVVEDGCVDEAQRADRKGWRGRGSLLVPTRTARRKAPAVSCGFCTFGLAR